MSIVPSQRGQSSAINLAIVASGRPVNRCAKSTTRLFRKRMMQVRALLLIVAMTASVQIALASHAIAEPYNGLVAKHAAANGVSESLVRRIIRIESRGNPRVVNKGNYGLMQIRLGTARGVGYRGTAQGLLDPDTNMTYAVKYLAA